ncbi:hypothetical protein ACJX0J_022638, partial [Zea mays]
MARACRAAGAAHPCAFSPATTRSRPPPPARTASSLGLGVPNPPPRPPNACPRPLPTLIYLSLPLPLPFLLLPVVALLLLPQEYSPSIVARACNFVPHADLFAVFAAVFCWIRFTRATLDLPQPCGPAGSERGDVRISVAKARCGSKAPSLGDVVAAAAVLRAFDPNIAELKPEEVAGIIKDFNEPGTLAPTGLFVGGTKYMVIQGEPGVVIRGKK